MKMKPEYELAKRLPGVSQLDRVRAARAILNGSRGSERLALRGFMAIFHPEYSDAMVRELVRDQSQAEEKAS